MDTDRVESRSADIVLNAFASSQLIEPLSSCDPALDEEGAYAIADEVHNRRVQRGENPVGRKIGFTNRTIWAEYGVSAPIWGYMYDSTVRYATPPTSRLDVQNLLQPRLEPEIQLHFARRPPVTRDEAAILDCIDWIALGYEIVQCPFADWRFTGVDAIAAFGVHGALMVGVPVPVSDIEDCAAKLRSFTVVLSKDGEQVSEGGGANVLESPLLAFAYLAHALAQQDRFPPVDAGEIVTTGTLTPLAIAQRGSRWATEVDGIELPAPSLSLD